LNPNVEVSGCRPSLLDKLSLKNNKKKQHKNSIMDIQQVQDKNLMSSSLPPISQSNVSFINAHIDNDGEHAFTSKNIFSKETGEYFNNQFDGQDPQDLALKFLTIMNITNLIGEEFKEMYPN
jgi:hypothetical protein